jgi:hypothetical protein
MSNDDDIDNDDIDNEDTNDSTIQKDISSSNINGAVDASSSNDSNDQPLMSLPRQKQQQQPYKAIGGSVLEVQIHT